MSFHRKRKTTDLSFEKAKKEVLKKSKTQLCVWIDSEEHKKLKSSAALQGITISEIICKSINIYLSKVK